MTLHEKVVLSAYTGILMCDFSEVHKYIEKLLGRPVWTHELASEALWPEIKEKAKPDFHKIIEPIGGVPMRKLYVCDRKRCGDRCHYPDCRHTTDISHALNAPTFPNGFEKVKHNGNVYFVERED